jgi:hypothetical protein
MSIMTCSVESCLRPAESKGLCSRHYRQLRHSRGNDLPRCPVPECLEPATLYGLCRRHGFRARRQAYWKQIIELKGGKCARCGGVFHPAAYDLHHIEQKAFEIAPLLTRNPTQELLEEIDKCELLCSNCHRTIQYGDEDLSGFYKRRIV